jgi:hypothetical protein
MQYIDKAISEHAKTIFQALPENVRSLIHKANHDLYFGPMPEDAEYPGFSSALHLINEHLEISDVYIDESGYVMECEPEGWIDEESGEYIEPMDYYLIEAKDILVKVVGKELHSYF